MEMIKGLFHFLLLNKKDSILLQTDTYVDTYEGNFWYTVSKEAKKGVRAAKFICIGAVSKIQ